MAGRVSRAALGTYGKGRNRSAANASSSDKAQAMIQDSGWDAMTMMPA
jgi:hypothetical protein